MPSETLRYDVISAADTRGLKDTAKEAAAASIAAKELSERLAAQSKTAQASSGATLAMAKADKVLRDAALELAVAEGKLTRAEAEQARGAEEAAVKTRAAGEAAKGAGSNFGLLASPMGAAIGAGVALAPVAVTLAAGLGGLGLAALSASKDARAMHQQLSPLKAEVADFQKSLKPEVLLLFGDGASIAETGLKGLQPVAAATGKALHGVLGDINANFKSGEWQQFFGFMERTAAPDMQLLGRLFIDVSNDVPPLLESLQPVATGLLKITDAIVRIPSALDAVKQKTGANQPGFFGGTGLDRIREFISWGEKHIPAGNKSISDLIGLTGRANSTASGAGAAVATVGAKAAAAAPKIGTLAGDMRALNAEVGSGNSVLAAYSDLWDRFVGKSVSDQQAILNITAAFESYNKTVQQSGRTSTAAQQSFLSTFDVLGNSLETLHKNGASVAEINKAYAITFDRLSALHGLTPQQRQDVAGLTQNYIAWASATDGLNKKLLGAAGTLRDTFLAQLANGHRVVPQTKADLDALASSVLKTGTDSTATAAARARLISDIYHSGLTAQAAQSLVRSFQGQINALKGKTVNVDVTASGSGGISVGATGLAARIFKLSHLATGGRVPGSGTGDTVPAMLTPGEVVVPVPMVRAGAVDHLRGRIPGFAAGGVAGMVPFTAGQEGSVIGGWAGQSASSMMDAILAQLRAQAAAASGSFTPGAPATGSAAAAQAFARSILPGGWSWPALLSLWQRESGWNAYAVNPSSGAYGIPQSLGHGHPYNLGDYANQVRWGISYIAGRYGNSQNAWAHELAFNWYDKGGYLPKGLSLAYNGTGRPEPVIPAGNGTGPLVIELHLDHGFADAGLSPQMLRNIKATVRHLGGRGPDAVTVAFGNN